MNIRDEAHFDEILANNDTVVVDFYADWCGPCKALGNMLNQYDGNTLIAKVDCDTLTSLAAKYNVRSIPYVVKFKGGQQVDSFVGLPNQTKLNEFLG